MKKMKSISYDKDHAELFLGAAITALREGMKLSIETLAETKGTDDLTWFDDLRREAVRSAKGTITEEVSVEVEARAIRFGFEVLDAELESLRRSLIQQE